LTHTVRYVLKLDSNTEAQSISPDHLPPQYCGRLTFRGTLKSAEVVTLYPKIWVTRPGTYGLEGWRLETEVGEPADVGVWRVRQRYVQGPPARDQACITIKDIASH